LGDDSIADINAHCSSEFKAHWKCLQNNNFGMAHCRDEEKPYNSCVFEKLVSDVSAIDEGMT
jgi:NADH dehydrogenase (ubiquinone) 1 alpha subcomplex subunit 8